METKICSNCGASMPLDSKFCTECGTPFPKEDKPAQEPRPENKAKESSPSPAPTYSAEITKESVAGTKYEPVSAFGWLGVFLLIAIPVIGPLLVIIWACCGCRKVNKRTFARGILLSWLILAIITVLTALALRGTIINLAKNYAEENNIPYSDSTVIEDALNGFLSQYGFEAN